MCAPEGRSCSQAFLAETVETGDKNGDVSQRHASFCEESLGRSDEKDDELFHEFYRLKALISLEQVNTNFSENLDGGVLVDRVLKTFIVCK